MFHDDFPSQELGMFIFPPLNMDGPPFPDALSPTGLGASLFLASDLFPARSLRHRRRLERSPLNALPPDRIPLYSGESLDQFDQDVFLACLMSDLRGRKPSPRSMRDVLRLIGCRPSAAQFTRLENSLLRLASARVELADNRFGCCIQLVESALVDRERGLFRVQTSPEVQSCFKNAKGLDAMVRLRFSLGRKHLTKWLAGFIFALGEEACHLDLERVRILCGREKTTPETFAEQALPALYFLVDAGYIHNLSRCPNGRIMIARCPGKSGSGECQLVW
jgi:hypothetical protein